MVLIIEISKIGNILATENQQARINGVIEIKRACICTELKQIWLMATKNTPSSNKQKMFSKSSVYAGLWALERSFDNKLITVV